MANTKELSEAQRHVLNRMANGATQREHWPPKRNTWYSLTSSVDTNWEHPLPATIDALRERGYIERLPARWGVTMVDYRLTDAGRQQISGNADTGVS